MAAKAEVSLTHLRNIEKAKANPTLDILNRLSKALGVRIIIIFVEDTAVEGEKIMGDPYRINEKMIELNGNIYHVYGITFGNRRIENITCDKEKMLCLIKRCNDGQLEEKYLPWVLSDFLNDKAFYIR